MEFKLDGQSALYKQIVEQILLKIKSGELPPGAKLPTERELARELGVARGTVKTAYAKMADNNITDSSAEWKGFGNMFGKNIASISTDAKGEFSQQVKDGETYTLQFSSDDAVWMIIECSKQGETQEGGRTTIVGEVLHVWVK